MMLRRKDQSSLSQGGRGVNEDKMRIAELNRQLDENNQQILLQKLEIR